VVKGICHGARTISNSASLRMDCPDIVRIENGMLAEHWDVIEDEVNQSRVTSGCQCLANSLVNDPPATAELVQKVVWMLDNGNFKDSETDRYIQLVNDFIVLAEKSCLRFIRAVQKLSVLSRPGIGAALDRRTGTYGLAVWRLDFQIGVSDGGRKRPA